MRKMTPIMAHNAVHKQPFVPAPAPVAVPNPSAPVGQGGRFQALKKTLAKKPGVTNPGGLAFSIGAKKYGKAKMTKMAVAGRKIA